MLHYVRLTIGIITAKFQRKHEFVKQLNYLLSILKVRKKGTMDFRILKKVHVSFHP